MDVIEQQLQDALQLMNCKLSKKINRLYFMTAIKINIEGYGSQKLIKISDIFSTEIKNKNNLQALIRKILHFCIPRKKPFILGNRKKTLGLQGTGKKNWADGSKVFNFESLVAAGEECEESIHEIAFN